MPQEGPVQKEKNLIPAGRKKTMPARRQQLMLKEGVEFQDGKLGRESGHCGQSILPKL